MSDVSWRDGYDTAIEYLRLKDAEEERAFSEAIKAHPENWDGWGYAHPYRKAAEYLEGLEP